MTRGIRILDKNNKVVSVRLSDILEEIHEGNKYFWSILEIEGIGYFDKGRSYLELVKKIEESERGLFISWNDLSIMSRKFHQIIWATIIGCKNKNSLHYYENDQEMYENCDIVIEMIDSSYWEVFSENKKIIDKLASKFKEVEFLEPNFEK